MSASNPFPGPMDLNGYQQISGTCSDRDMLKVVNGALVRILTLVDVPTNGLRPLLFALTYDCQSSNPLGPVGTHWFHNWQINLTGIGTSVVTVVFETGRQYNFTEVVGSSSEWVLDKSTSTFIPATLTNPSPGIWLLNIYPDSGYYQFNGDGVLMQAVDNHGNTLSLAYSAGGLLTSVTESAGSRQITFAYTGSLLTSVTDPNGNGYTLQFDGSSNLTEVIGPSGCVLSYGYSTPSNNLLTSRTDPNGNTYTYVYNGSNQVTQIQDAESPPNTLTYAYDTPLEEIGDVSPTSIQISRTQLTDARGQLWQYHFDTGGNVWRIIDPTGHWRRFYWTIEQKLLYATADSPQIDPIVGGTVGGPRDNTYNSLSRNCFDPLGNLLCQIGPTGRVDQFQYDANNRLITSYSGQGDIGVQGNWVGQYGQDGYLLCAWNSGGTDVSNLPSYISGVTPTGVTKTNYNNSVVLMDPRAPVCPDASTSTGTQKRGVGLWSNLGTSSSPGSFTVAVAVNAPKTFNLSLYSHALDQSSSIGPVVGPYFNASLGGSNLYYAPLTYSEQFGCYIQYEVTDANGTQTFTVYNNGPGMWVSFPVTTTAEVTSVTVTVTAIFNPDSSGNGTLQAQISALAFDPYESRLVTRNYAESVYGTAVYGTDSYGGDGDLTSIVGPLGTGQSMTWHSDGTQASGTDSLSNTTKFFYTDAARNLTQIVDPSGATWNRTFDLNSNMLTEQNPNGHTTTTTFDGKNRPLTITTSLGFQTSMEYDGAGNLIQLKDQLGRITLFGYSPTNRLISITDSLLGETLMTHDQAGNLLSVQDQRKNTSQLLYDAAGRMIQVTQPDSQLVQLALDAMDRVVAITTPNGTQANLASINVTNGANLVRNPGVETANPLDSTGLSAQFWLNSLGGSSNNRDNTHSHSGTWSLPTTLAASATQTWTQNQLALPAGGSYLANVWTEKTADGIAATVSLTATVLSLQHTVETLAGPATTLNGSSTTWQQLATPFQFNVPGDSMFTRFSTTEFLATVTNESSSTSTEVWLDDFTVTPLSTTYGYDFAGAVQEVRRPDGSRWRLYRDRFNRVVIAEDPKGQQTLIGWDSLDRVVFVKDPLANQTNFGWDTNNNLISVTNTAAADYGDYGTAIYGTNVYAGSSVETQFLYNSRNLLATIVYPDASTEQFSYDPAANLLTYEDNQLRVRSFYYDNDERLIEVLYSDSTQLDFTYDQVNNVLTRLERNGDLTTYVLDALNRVVSEVRSLGISSPNAAWSHGQTFDATSNRTQFDFHASAYGTAVYGTDIYGAGTATWSVLNSEYGTAAYGAALYGDVGYDAMNRMPGYLDAVGNQVRFGFDVEGRRTEIVFPFGSPLVTTTATYDIIGRLLSQVTAQGSTSLLSLSYGYDQASNRIGMVAGADSFDYDLDASNRLISVSQNVFVEQLAEHFELGTCSGTELDAATPGIRLLASNDAFSGTNLDLDRWRLAYLNNTVSVGSDVVGMEIRQNNGLLMAYPRGYADLGPASTQQGWADPYGIYEQSISGAAELRTLLSGDLNVQVSYSDYQAIAYPASFNFVQMGLVIRDTPMDQTPPNQLYICRSTDQAGNQTYLAQIVSGGGSTVATAATTDTSGQLRLQRTGSTVTLSYFSGGTWNTLLTSATWTTAGSLYLGLYMGNMQATGSCCFSNFTVTAPNQYPSTGTYTSAVYDCGNATPTWGTISWQATLPASTSVELQLASSSSPNGPWTFLGPTGAASYYTSSGTSIPSTGAGAITGRYLKYQATLAGPGTSTPELTQVMATYTGTNTSTFYGYAYDARGNISGTTTQTSAGTATEARTFNNLNQITANVVTPVSGSPTTFDFSWNPDGTLASKTDGTNTWAYTWDPGGDQRLLSMVYNGVTQVSFTYDSMGRMLTRTPYSGGVAGGSTQFVWDAMTVVQEITPTGIFRYYAPQGELLTFDFTTGGTTTTYCAHADALGSIRAITGAAGTVLAHYEYDAWGNQLSSSSDLTPSFAYRYVGAWGVRWDATLGMYYCQQRWYDPAMQRWISREPLLSGRPLIEGSSVSPIPPIIDFLRDVLTITDSAEDSGLVSIGFNQYPYVENEATNYSDPTGLGGGTIAPPTVPWRINPRFNPKKDHTLFDCVKKYPPQALQKQKWKSAANNKFMTDMQHCIKTAKNRWIHCGDNEPPDLMTQPGQDPNLPSYNTK